MIRIDLDRERCEGHAMCEAFAPEFFSVDDEGTLTVVAEIVPAGSETTVHNAVSACPVAALKITALS
ncbi:ferredoxin [Mycobacterium deserti]|uniref:Ferredoxin n=1 Tax=Mycobacterium deserti TaxID=2978347 RepID=A0ABT2MHX8_9MYCO|nr:ferredoxin [Mycobacterium deserti]MCT7660705.1 ferredoxin [Mycobacterium deserti]